MTGSEIVRPGAVKLADAIEGTLMSSVPLAQFDGPQARLGVGGPLDGKVLHSASTRLDYRKPTITVKAGGHDDGVTVDAEPLMTYLPKTLQVLGLRSYRFWVIEEEWEQAWVDREAYNTFEAEVILRLIDATPADCRACQVLS